MQETFELLISHIFLDTLDTINPKQIDHIKVSPDFMNYIAANALDDILLEKADSYTNGIVSKYEGIPIIADNTLEDHYEVVRQDGCYIGKLVDFKNNVYAECDNPKTKYDYIFKKEN